MNVRKLALQVFNKYKLKKIILTIYILNIPYNCAKQIDSSNEYHQN